MQRRLAAILSADVQGYSRMMSENEVATVQTLSASRRLVITSYSIHYTKLYEIGLTLAALLAGLRRRGIGARLAATLHALLEFALAGGRRALARHVQVDVIGGNAGQHDHNQRPEGAKAPLHSALSYNFV